MAVEMNISRDKLSWAARGTPVFDGVLLALSRGEGSEIWNALGSTVIGGLFVTGMWKGAKTAFHKDKNTEDKSQQ